jgi:DUF1365 family protein
MPPPSKQHSPRQGADPQDSNPHRIYFTRVMHRRLFPVNYKFIYKVFSLLIDIDALEQLPRGPRIGRFQLVRFNPADHGPSDGSPLRPWAEQVLRARGIELDGGRIRLLCFPRVLGYGFNPLSVWYCEHRDGSLRAAIAEVSNTFGEKHFYLLAEEGKPIDWPLRARAEKCFHVSPLMDMGGDYRFRLSEPDDDLSVMIRQFHSDGRLKLVASQGGTGEPLTEQSLRRALKRMPLMTIKVIAAIHWQALKIWLRGAPMCPTPPAPEHEVT